jgi:hypothetical protein
MLLRAHTARRLVAGLAVAGLFSAVAVERGLAEQPQGVIVTMSPENIADAIALGHKQAFRGNLLSYSVPRCTHIFFSTPWSRVVSAAQDAARHYKPFTAADVTPEMLAPEVVIYALPEVLGRGVASYDTLIVTRAKSTDLDDVIPPVRQKPISRAFSNVYGAARLGTGIEAAYPLRIMAPGFEVRTVQAETPTRCSFQFTDKNVLKNVR